MIKIKLGEIVFLNEIIGRLMEIKFPGQLTFKIARLAREIVKENQIFEEARFKIAEKYGKRKEDGNLQINENGEVTIEPDKYEECNKELTDLFITEIELNVDKIPIDAFEKIELTPRESLIIEGIIE